MSPLTTHVLDTALGVPARGMRVALAQFHDTEFVELAVRVTNGDGRVTDLCEGKLARGVYRLSFDSAGYFSASERACFYPYVEVVFEVTSETSHLHVPLLVSPYGYSTYRGS